MKATNLFKKITLLNFIVFGLSSCSLFGAKSADDYSIEFTEDFPMTKSYGFKYNNSIKTSCEITKVNFEIQKEYLCVFYYGKKTYDVNGETSNESVSFEIIFKDSDGDVLTSDTVYSDSLVVGQRLGEDGYIGRKLVKESSLSKSKSYILCFYDHII